jgi:alpha-tubulin suppressor-like RCC1 family protein
MRAFRLLAVVALVVGGLAVVVVPAGVASADDGVAAISAGGASTCAVTTAGAAKCWGWNHDGQLGDGTNVDQTMPVDVVGLGSGIETIATNALDACVVTTGGAAKCWGWNGSGILGDGTTNNSNVPVDVSGLGSGVAAIGVADQSCALTTVGGVECWGDNTFGELGDGTTTERHTPVDVSGLSSGVSAISVGGGDACALTSAGAVKCWGDNENGRLGDGTTTNRSTPVDVVGLGSGVVAINAGDSQTCAVMSVGAVKCWGDNSYEQLGDGTNIDRHTPVDVVGLDTDVVSVSGGGGHTCVLSTAGAVECWGRNDWGQLGHGPGATTHTPVAVAGLGTGVAAVSAGGDHTCALMTDGAMLCWGNNFEGQLGNGTAVQLPTPNAVAGLGSGVAAVTAGYHHSCAVMTDATAECWGLSDHGQVGDGTTLERDRPVEVAGLADVHAIAAGYEHTCALTNSGAVECWGNNEHGQLGDGTTIQRNAPVQVSGLESGVVAISTGIEHSCALTDTGAMKCWGANDHGQLGDATNTDRLTPVTVTGLGSPVAGIAAGVVRSCAVTTGGAVKCWGQAYLGDGTTQSSNVPVDVAGLGSGVASISAGAPSCAVTTAGGLKCWGDGYLGDGSSSIGFTPVDVASLGTNVAAVVANGSGGGCALMTNAAAKCWGYNAYGEVGDGTTTDRATPVDVTGLGSGVAGISARGDHACAVTTTGAAVCWGNNTTGQLGVGTSGFTTVPIGVVGLGLNGATAPDAPGSVSASAADGAAGVSWTPPADDGGAPVYGYLVTITSASGGLPSGVSGSRVRLAADGLTLSTNTSLHVGGLSNGTGYRLDVAPINRAGIGTSILSSVVQPAAHPTAGGYWMAGATGSVYAFGNAQYHGNAPLSWVTHIEPTPTKQGYWIVNAAGTVSAFGDARVLPGAGTLAPGEIVTSLASTSSGSGYWLFTNRGRVISRGTAKFFGDLQASTLNGSIVGSVATPTGKGYYMVGSDGGVFAFGDARFHGSMGAKHLNAPIESLVPTADNRGYWLVASDGGIFAFGAPFRGSMGAHPLNRPVIGMVRYGNGYLMVGSDGGVFTFSNLAFRGSLAAHPPAQPIVSVAASS